MPTSKRSKRDQPKCAACKRTGRDISRSHMRQDEHAYWFYRCVCGNEWTEDVITVDMHDPVTADEVLQVHEAMQKLEGPLSELLEAPE